VAHKVKHATVGNGRDPAPNRFPTPTTLPSVPAEPRWLAALLVLVLVSRAVVFLLDPARLADRTVIQDDAFYYLEIAAHFLRGEGLTWDGLEPTNGFHPLYALLMVAVVLVTGSSGTAPLAVMMGMGVILSVVVALLLERLAFRRGVGGWSSLLLAASPTLWLNAFNGLETMLAAVAALLVVDAHDRWLRGGPVSGAAFGGLCGLAILARSDLVLLVGPVVAHRLWLARGREGDRGWMALPVITGIWGAWLLYSLWATGSALPSSGGAQREMAIDAGWASVHLVLPVDVTVPESQAPGLWSAQVLTNLVLLALLHPLLAPLSLDVPPGVHSRDLLDWWLARAVHEAPWLLGLIALGVVAVMVWGFRRSGREQGLALPLYAWAVLFVAGYAFYAPAVWFFDRYLTVPALVAMPLALGVVASVRRPRARWVLVAWLGLAAIGGVAGGLGTVAPTVTVDDPLDEDRLRAVALRLDRTLPKGTVIAGFQTGTLAWFSSGPVVNLDGKMSARARRLRGEGRLAELICARGVAIVVDEVFIVENAIGTGVLPPDLLDTEQQVWPERQYHRGSIRPYRVVGCPSGPDGGATRQAE
jgi:4-amino-4-deoxy-L-arabinose transferase-like glycosyltransferase